MLAAVCGMYVCVWYVCMCVVCMCVCVCGMYVCVCGMYVFVIRGQGLIDVKACKFVAYILVKNSLTTTNSGVSLVLLDVGSVIIGH